MSLHLQLLGCLSIAGSVLRLIILIVMGSVQSAFGQYSPSFVTSMASVLIILLGATMLLGFICGYGLLTKKSWSRMPTLVLSCISLLSFPIGTALGVYGLWILLNEDAIELLN